MPISLNTRRLSLLICLTLLLLSIAGSACCSISASPSNLTDPGTREVLYQVSTLEALTAGLFKGMVTIEQLKVRGDFGIGTTEGLNGEMLVLDGHYYRIRHDGGVDEIGQAEKVPFAMVTYFDSDTTFDLPQGLDYVAVSKYIDGKLPTLNSFQAIRIKGLFGQVKARSPSRQVIPYPSLTEALKTQNIFDFKDIEGVMVGWRYPDFGGVLNASGYHFHFLTADQRAGGHVLEFITKSAAASVDYTPGYMVELPENDPVFNTLRTTSK